jgi:hypothetical protein
MFVLAFVVEFEIGYNSFMHKTQPQKLLFIAFLVGPTHKTPPPPQKQTPSNIKRTRVMTNQSDFQIACMFLITFFFSDCYFLRGDY